MALPWLESLSSRFTGGGLALAAGGGERPVAGERPRRMVCIGNQLGFYGPEFHPSEPGRDYSLPKLLRPLQN